MAPQQGKALYRLEDDGWWYYVSLGEWIRARPEAHAAVDRIVRSAGRMKYLRGADLEDFVQDAMFKVVSVRVNDVKQVAQFIFVLAVNMAIDQHRKAQRLKSGPGKQLELKDDVPVGGEASEDVLAELLDGARAARAREQAPRPGTNLPTSVHGNSTIDLYAAYLFLARARLLQGSMASARRNSNDGRQPTGTTSEGGERSWSQEDGNRRVHTRHSRNCADPDKSIETWWGALLECDRACQSYKLLDRFLQDQGCKTARVGNWVAQINRAYPGRLEGAQ